ncbi:MAG: epoxyqueuosine reductase QueH [Roseburia sp.]|nr:epoxyqueuosine reductase QueH [Roseburia sp.]MCM1279347.1 epoxyqueuosine reductase QueH [Robinsoniella sp.]
MMMEKILQQNSERGKSLFLHSCCAPCSSYVLTYLRSFFKITVFYYNPNITEDLEYKKRVEEQKRFILKLNEEAGADGSLEKGKVFPISFQEGEYMPELFFQLVKGHEADREGGGRCYLCYEMRLREAALYGKEQGFDYFTTTLSISPLKNAKWLNEIGERMGEEYGISYLPSDFKKKDGYKKSILLSGEYDLYRQDYCGCVFSKRERQRNKGKEE